MGSVWDDPPWRSQGRTGPGPAAPKYARRSDRRAVRNGRQPGKSSGSGSKSMLIAAISFLALPVGLVGGIAAWLAHGYGVL